MTTRRLLCFMLAALCALQPALPALADGASTTLSPTPHQMNYDQLMAERYGPLSYRPEPLSADPLTAPPADASTVLMTAASGADDAGSSSGGLWLLVGIIVVVALVAGGGGGGGY
jgi:hypothetical protein